MTTIDICLIAGRRPDLLERTLESFQRGMFKHFDVAHCYVNIDPIFGEKEDALGAEAVIKSFFRNAEIHQPIVPNFCVAVRHVWQSSQSDFIFHLEDDWLLNEDITPDQILPVFNDTTIAQVSLNNRHKHWNFKNGPFSYNYPHRKFFWMKFRTGDSYPCFTTSPTFVRGEFARQASKLMNENYDPEKQFYNGMNRELMSFVKPYQNYIYGEGKPFIITDIGREWRDDRQISKKVIDGTSVWVPSKK